MKIVFLASAAADLTWFRSYYNGVFPEGRGKAQAHFRKARQGLVTNPQPGRALESPPGMRELIITKTPFSLIYYLSGQQIRIVRLWDGRSQRPEEWH